MAESPLPKGSDPTRKIALASAVMIAASLVVGWWIAGLVAENGAFELATVVALLITTGVAVAYLQVLGPTGKWHLPLLTFAMALRELDFDKRFMETGILKLRLYTGDNPLVAKIIGALVIVLVLSATWRAIRLNGPSLLRAIRKRKSWALLIVGGIVALVVAKTFDGFARKLAPLGIDVPPVFSPVFVALEESLEFGCAVALLSALLLWLRPRTS